jgi:hypothetical protein
LKPFQPAGVPHLFGGVPFPKVCGLLVMGKLGFKPTVQRLGGLFCGYRQLKEPVNRRFL